MTWRYGSFALGIVFGLLLALVLVAAVIIAAVVAYAAEPLPLCAGPDRSARGVTCIVDGDTFWLDGEKMRVARIDAPELRGRCRAERRLAIVARDRLAGLLSDVAALPPCNAARIRDQPDCLSRAGVGRYGRTLVSIRVGGADVGDILIGEGLAARYGGGKPDWCGER